MTDSETAMTPEMQAVWLKIVAHAWSDDEFKQKLLDNPHTALADAGLPVSHDINYIVVENEPQRIHLVLPARPLGDVSISHMTGSDYDPGF